MRADLARAPPIPLDVAFASNVAASDRRSTLSRATVSLVRQIHPDATSDRPNIRKIASTRRPSATRELTPTISSPLIPPDLPAAVTVADTKKKFVDAYPFPIPSVWSVALRSSS